jgi:hypothetical protein
MSTLSMRLKQRARMLAAGAVLSAATLALIPGVAEATDPTDCVCRVIGDITDTSNPTQGPSDGSQEPSDGPDNSAKLVGLQDTSAADDSLIGNDNVSGNSVGVSAPIASDGSGSEFSNDASSTDNTSSNGGANSPSTEERNSADLAGAQDTSVLNGSEIGNDNLSGNSVSLSTPVLSNDSGSRFDNDANSTNGTGGNANSPSGEERNTADIAGAQDTELANGTEILNRNASGNSVGVSAPIASDGSGSEFGNDASSTSSRGNGNANSPGGNKQQNDADVAGLQDTELANDSQIGNGNASGNSVGASGPVLSDDSSSRFNNDASSTSSGSSGNANVPSGDKQNDADVAGSQDTSVLNGSETLNRNASGNSVGVSAPLLSKDSGSRFDNDASSTDNTSSGNGGANSPSGEKRNSADLAGAQDTSALNGSQTGNDNASGNSVGVSAPVLSKDSGSRFDNDASSTDNTGNGKANSPSGDKQNDADIAGSQDASVLNGSETLNRNASGNSAGISAPIASDGSGSRFDNDASSTDNGGSDNGGSDNGGSNDSGKNPNSGNGNGDEAGDPGKSQPNNNGGDDGSPNSGGQTAKS